MEYTRYHEIEKLLELFADIQAMAESIRKEIGNLNERDDANDGIYALALNHKATNDISGYSSGAISDKTAKVATGYGMVLDNERLSASNELRSELLIVEVVIEKINIGLNVLTQRNREIVTLRYLEGMTWIEIADRILNSESSCRRLRKEAVERINRISKISIEMYKEVLRLLEVNL